MSRRVAIHCRSKAVRANRAAEGALRDVASKEGWTVTEPYPGMEASRQAMVDLAAMRAVSTSNALICRFNSRGGSCRRPSGHRGRSGRAAVKELRKRHPKFSVRRVAKAILFKNPAETERIVERLRRLGLPE